MKGALSRCWYERCPALILLWPLAGLFLLVVWLRRWSYRLGLLRSDRLHVPVIVVGNITVGGTGKTPLTIKLVEWLRTAGYHPGVVSRGYAGRSHVPQPVYWDSEAAEVGDEPVLIARRAACPVWVGRQRGEAARALLASHPDVDVIVADDGLQHYALRRDFEIAVVDGERGLGNGWLLPAGPLREPRGRLAEVDAVVVNAGEGRGFGHVSTRFTMSLQGARFRSLRDPQRSLMPAELRGQPIHALAGIGHPQRFFRQLRGLGLDIVPHAFPDHHAYSPADLPEGVLVMTEKDAVKCASFASEQAWFLEVDAEVGTGLQQLLLERLKAWHGRETT